MQNLNRAQRQAANLSDQHSLIIAGAGTGKTATLIAKVGTILEQGNVDPSRILLLTFSKKAAEEMSQRLQKRFGEYVQTLFAGTFHSFCYLSLKEHSELFTNSAGYKSFPTLVTDTQNEEIRLELFEAYAYRFQGIPLDVIDNILQKIHDGKLSDKELKKSMSPALVTALYEYRDEYLRKKIERNCFEFSDLLVWVNKLFEDNRDFRDWIAQKYAYVLVDEFQDSSFYNCRLIQNLVSAGAILCAVGDDYQSIYGFRGASPEIMMDIRRYFSSIQCYKLTINYRSHSEIVAVSNRLIKHNSRQLHKKMSSYKGSGGEVHLHRVNSFEEECSLLAELLKKTKVSEQAVLYRNNKYGAMLELKLAEREITHKPEFITFHSSKGLEYEHVIVCGLHTAQVPSPGNSLDEERRLLYVALTRSKTYLDIIYYGDDSEPCFIKELGLFK